MHSQYLGPSFHPDESKPQPAFHNARELTIDDLAEEVVLTRMALIRNIRTYVEDIGLGHLLQ